MSTVKGLGKIAIHKLPMLKIYSGRTPDKTKTVGDMFNGANGNNYGSEAEFIAYAKFLRRSKFGANQSIECFSPDNTTGFNGKKCATCNLRRSNENKDVPRAELCTDQVVYTIAPLNDPDDWMSLVFKGGGMKRATQLEKQLMAQCLKAKTGISGVSFKLATAIEKNQTHGSTYWVFNIAPGSEVPVEQREVFDKTSDEISESLAEEIEDFYKYARSSLGDMAEAGDDDEAGIPALTVDTPKRVKKDAAALV